METIISSIESVVNNCNKKATKRKWAPIPVDVDNLETIKNKGLYQYLIKAIFCYQILKTNEKLFKPIIWSQNKFNPIKSSHRIRIFYWKYFIFETIISETKNN